MATAATCPTGEYAKRLRTTSGLTLTSPTGLFTSEYDYEEWYEVALESRALAERGWRALLALPQFVSATDAKADVGSVLQRARDTWLELPLPWDWATFGGQATAISRAIAAASDFLCARQKIDELLVGFGVTPPDVPPVKGEGSGMGILETLAVVTGAVVVVVGGVMLVKAVAK